MKNSQVLLWALVVISLLLSVWNMVGIRLNPNSSSAASIKATGQISGCTQMSETVIVNIGGKDRIFLITYCRNADGTYTNWQSTPVATN